VSTPHHHGLPDPAVWLGVHDASAMLGVSPATLRRWSVAGKIETFRTPGGHRRYSRSTLEGLLPSPGDREPSLASIGATADHVVGLLRARGAGDDPSYPEVAPDPDTAEVLALAGRAMVAGVLAYVDGTSHEERESALAAAAQAAALHGHLAARGGTSLGDTVAAFHRRRSLLLDVLGDLACRHGVATPVATRMLARANDAADRLVVTLVSAHVDAASGIRA